MKDASVSRRYARAVFQAAQQNRSEEIVFHELTWLSRQVLEQPALAAVLRHPRVRTAKKMSFMERWWGSFPEHKPLSPIAKNFLRILLHNKRSGLLPLVALNYEKFWNESRGIVKARVRIAGEADFNRLGMLSRTLGGVSRREVKLEMIEDSRLLAGFTLSVEDMLWDASLKGRLERMKDHFKHTLKNGQ
ncbi:MAG TPA: ATP synthase F1 subunit delta [Elusimicrobiota bacterium]|nr:ATP synthase F1 subunit delta [Elusimicrobiota bacterium]